MSEKKTRQFKGKKEQKEKEEFEQQIVDLARVTRVMAGGKRMRFRATVVIGDRKGRVAIGVAKGADVTIAINKAVAKAKKDIIHVDFPNDTIAHTKQEKYRAAKVLLKPATAGKGIVAGGAMRNVLELCGVPNVVGKIQGSSNRINVVRATMNALRGLRKVTPRIIKKTVDTVVLDVKKDEVVDAVSSVKADKESVVASVDSSLELKSNDVVKKE